MPQAIWGLTAGFRMTNMSLMVLVRPWIRYWTGHTSNPGVEEQLRHISS